MQVDHIPSLTEQAVTNQVLLEKCYIFLSGPQGEVGLLSHLNEPLPKRLGKLQGEQYFLRFVNDPLANAGIWVWLAILSV